MIFGFVSQLRNKERGFNYKPISYDPDMKDFRDKVKERQQTDGTKKFSFRKHQQKENRKVFQKQVFRFAFILLGLLAISYLIFTSSALDSFANWLVNA